MVLFCGLLIHAAPIAASPLAGVEPRCPPLNEGSADLPPVEHYTLAGQCTQLGKLEGAVSHYALAAAFARFDMLRVPDPTAHPVITREPLAANAKLSDAEKAKLHHATLARQASPVEMVAMCKALAYVGPPRYHPEYMAKYGVYAGPKGKGRPVTSLTNAPGQWKKLLGEFIGCPPAAL